MGQGGRFTEVSKCCISGFGFLNAAHQEHSGGTINDVALIFKCVMSIAVVTIANF